MVHSVDCRAVRLALGGLLVCLLAMITPAEAASIVVPPGNAAVEGNAAVDLLLKDPRTTQFVYDDSLLAGMPAGSLVTGMRFRQKGGRPTGPTTDQTWADYNVVMGPSNFAPGSLDSTFADNIGAGSTTVMSGPLTVLADSFPGGAVPNAFGPLFGVHNPAYLCRRGSADHDPAHGDRG